TGGAQYLDAGLDGYQAHGLPRRAKRENKHALVANRQIGVVGRLVPTVDVVVAVKASGGRAEGGTGGYDRIDQIDATIAVENAPLASPRVSSNHEQPLFWPRLLRKLGRDNLQPIQHAVPTATLSARAPRRPRISQGLQPASRFGAGPPSSVRR